MKKQRSKIKRKRKVNNRGMSLVEVLVAMTIFGIVAIPVLHSLTTSMVYNAKGRARQKLTLTAETIMETFNGYDIKSVQEMFATGSGIPGIVCSGYEAPDEAKIDDHVSQLDFAIKDLDVDDGKLYNVDITVNPGITKDIFEMKNMDTSRDAIFISDRDYDKKAVENAYTDFSSAANKNALKDYFDNLKDGSGTAIDALNADDVMIKDNIDIVYTGDGTNGKIEDYIKLHDRRLRFVIKDDGAGNNVVTVQMVYRYYIHMYPYYIAVYPPHVDDDYPDADGTPVGGEQPFVGSLDYLRHYPVDAGGNNTYLQYTVELGTASVAYDRAEDYTDANKNFVVYKNPEAAKLNRLFIYYYPQYDLGESNDIIEIKNEANIENFQCYIIKQLATDISANRIKIEEGGYRANVEVNNSAGGFKVYHNFEENIAGGSSHTAPNITGTCDKIGYIDQTEFSQNEVLSYRVKIVVTNKEGGSTVTELESTINEKIKTSKGVVD